MGRAGNDPKPNHGIARFHEKYREHYFRFEAGTRFRAWSRCG